MTDLKEDNKELNTDEINELFNKIDSINEVLIANKKYYNKNNNLLMKTIKGYIKVIAKINNIKVTNCALAAIYPLIKYITPIVIKNDNI